MKAIFSKTYAIALISALAAAGVTGSLFAGAQVAESQQYAALSSESPTIRVTGDASMSVVPDQATMIVQIPSKPDDLDVVIAEQEQKAQQITLAIQDAVGDNATVAKGSQYIYPNYGGGAPVTGDVTFTVQSSVQIQTDIEHLSGLVNKIAEAGYGFENVYFDPRYSASLVSGASGVEPTPPVEEGGNPITIGVFINTKPDVLTSAIEEYEGKYRQLLTIMDEEGIPRDQIRQNNFYIYPNFYGPSVSSGYNMSTQLVVKTSADNIKKVTDAVTSVGGAFVENTFLSISDAAIDEARKELGRQAFDNAKSRADEIAESLGLEVKGVKRIEASGSDNNPNYGYSVFEYRGVKIIPPYYYQNMTGEISVSQTVEFELGSP